MFNISVNRTAHWKIDSIIMKLNNLSKGHESNCNYNLGLTDSRDDAAFFEYNK